MINLFGPKNGIITGLFGGSVNKREELEQLIKERMNGSSGGSSADPPSSGPNVLMILGVVLIAAVFLRR